MRTRLLLALALLLVVAVPLAAHDLFLRPDAFFAPPDARIRVAVLNGTFDRSENPVDVARLADLSLVSPAGRRAVARTEWRADGTRSLLGVRTGTPGTYVVGASLKPRQLSMKGNDFNAYLEEDGIPEILAARREANELEKGATERYAKHVKTLVQVGARRDSGYAHVLGYPAEIVPLENPYALRAGDSLSVRCLVDGVPVPGQTVLAGSRPRQGARPAEQRVRTDADGIARIRLGEPGPAYVKFVHMVPAGGREGLDYESKWASLTFEVR